MVDLRSRFTGLYCGVIYDSMAFDIKYSKPFVVSKAIKPQWNRACGQVLFGHAFTCKGQRVLHEEDIDDSIRIKMFQDFTEGCVQVIDADNDSTVAHFGDISAKLARKFGCVGAVIDGYTRDLKLIAEDDFPIFCRGTLPVDAYGKWQIVDFQTKVVLSGTDGRIVVSPNDYVFGDPDGILVISASLIEDVCRLAEERVVREDMVRERLKSAVDIQRLYNEIGRW